MGCDTENGKSYCAVLPKLTLKANCSLSSPVSMAHHQDQLRNLY